MLFQTPDLGDWERVPLLPHSSSKFQYLLVLAEKDWHHTSGIEPATQVLGQFHNSSLALTGATAVDDHLPKSRMGPAYRETGLSS